MLRILHSRLLYELQLVSFLASHVASATVWLLPLSLFYIDGSYILRRRNVFKI